MECALQGMLPDIVIDRLGMYGDEEAQREGFELIAITDHLEYQPKKEDIPNPDFNRSYQIAKESVGGGDLIVLPGSEITRNMPPGHFNAIFIKDANKLLFENDSAPVVALSAANPPI